MIYFRQITGLRADFTSKLVHGLAFGIPKFYTAPYDKINHGLVNLSCNCDVKSGLRSRFDRVVAKQTKLTLFYRPVNVCRRLSDHTTNSAIVSKWGGGGGGLSK